MDPDRSARAAVRSPVAPATRTLARRLRGGQRPVGAARVRSCVGRGVHPALRRRAIELHLDPGRRPDLRDEQAQPAPVAQGHLGGRAVLVVTHRGYLHAVWELHRAWHDTIPPYDWAWLTLRRRDQLDPEVGFCFPSQTDDHTVSEADLSDPRLPCAR